MASKAYSPEQRKEIRTQLLAVGLRLYSQNGIRAVRLTDILEVVCISKPFFYKFFGSVQEFVIEVLNSQWEPLALILDEAEQQSGGCWKTKVAYTLEKFIHHQDHGLLVMSQEEEMWVRERITDELYHSFMTTQQRYFEELFRRWEIPKEKCSPKVLANMILTVVIIFGSAKRSLPFLHLDELEQTAQAQIECLVMYLESLKQELN